MQARFLLGPAGSGKTFRCLAEIRAELLRAPDGPPLILLAPKQATFQLERQLLAGTSLPGCARLQIFSFERLARFVLEELRAAPAPALSEQGRVMVLRALLRQRADELKRFDKSARCSGFAQQLSALLAELQSHGLSAARLVGLSRRSDLPPELQAKLHDLAVLAQAYADWLAEHELQDANRLLDSATEALRASSGSKFQGPNSKAQSPESREPAGTSHFAIRHSSFVISALWHDGFAEMTPAELDLLAAVLPHCERATLAFCVDHEPRADESWHSIWSVVGKTFLRCRERVAALPDAEVKVEILERNPAQSRFADNSALAHLEANWSQPQPFTIRDSPFTQPTPRLITCANPDAEAAFSAREILKFVRAGGRFREAAVLVRQLDDYHKSLARAFRRYGVPFFLDRREGVAHHPLAELTRSALRTVAFEWHHEDWFAALKAGFSAVEETQIDRLENEALARGWRGAKWRSPVHLGVAEADLGARLEQLREELLPPFARLAERLALPDVRPTGAQLAAALREFWRQLDVERTLERWVAEGVPSSGFRVPSSVHATVFTEMNAWLDNLALAFPAGSATLPLRDWLPVLEAGLANLTVGVIPPALDQVLIGAIDRARNPELKLAFVLGLNEGVFPAAPATPVILTEDDREKLDGGGVALGPDLRDRLARERFYGYIACTRASEWLVLTRASHGTDGRALNPSPFVAHVKRLFPKVETEECHAETDWREAEHVCELIAPLVEMQNGGCRMKNWEALVRLPALSALVERLGQLRKPDPAEGLTPGRAKKLFGPVLKTSVSRLENFAACPFRFFIHSGLRAEERKVFELDFREQGSFQHAVLKIFHEELQTEGRRWRDLTPAEARDRVARIAGVLTTDYREGLLRDSPQTQFTAGVLARVLQDFIEVLVGWMHGRYQFDPAAVELDFDEGGQVPAWTLELGAGRQLQLRGRIDRVDLWHMPGADAAWCVVIDYKSGAKKLDPVLLEHGLQLQLLSYLNVLRHWPDPRPLGVRRLVPAGVFYVSLRGAAASGSSRAVLGGATAARKATYRHTGRFDVSALPKLDASGDEVGEQFNYRRNQDGSLRANLADAKSPEAFGALLARAEAQLRVMGERIFSGEAKVDPYRKGSDTPCEFCDYASVCRIDPWTHEYRMLRKAEAAEAEA
jgi:ATP-dependent helicase/nuclease subunit B